MKLLRLFADNNGESHFDELLTEKFVRLAPEQFFSGRTQQARVIGIV